MIQEAATMALPLQSPGRPKLTLQTQSCTAPPAVGKSLTSFKPDADPTSVTAFNTLSNAYAAAIDLSSPKAVALPPTPLDPRKTAGPARKTNLRLITNASALAKEPMVFPSQKAQTPGPFSIVYPDTPTATLSATSSPIRGCPEPRPVVANPFAFTPPQSAHPADGPMVKVFSYVSKVSYLSSPISVRTPRRRPMTDIRRQPAPYIHPRSLRSILRNSPLPAKTPATSMSPTRSSRRIADRAAKKLAFNSPLTETITTERYIKSHIDILLEEASPFSPGPGCVLAETPVIAMAYTGETTDCGQTPGPFEEMRRRMAGLGPEIDGEHAGVRKKRRREKKRQWVWTIGTNEDDEDDEKQRYVSTPIAVAELPHTPIAETGDVEDEDEQNEKTGDTRPLAIDPELQEMVRSEMPPGQSEDIEMVDRVDKSDINLMRRV